MKKYIFLFLLSFLFSCQEKPKVETQKQEVSLSTINWEDKYKVDSTACIVLLEKDSIKILKLQSSIDSILKVNHNLKDSLFLRKAQIADCKKYLKICIRNPSQDKFLKGWLIRALDL